MTDTHSTDRPPDHYRENYQSEERWLSYARQLSLARSVVPKRALEVGVGPGALRAMFSVSHPECEFVGLDIRDDLRPAVCGDVRRLPFQDRTFDIVYCCQVLEHLPYDDFQSGLSELRRVARKRVVVSLPDDSRFLFVRIPGLRRVSAWLWNGFSLPRFPARTIDVRAHGQHHWEIGRVGYPASRIRADAQDREFRITSEFRMVERSYWHFYVFDRKSS